MVKEKSIFKDIPEVTLLENEESWMNACKLLYQKWKQNNKRLEYTLRLLWECWYFDLEDACFIFFSEEETQAVHRIFKEVYSHSERHFRNESKYLWLTAYMLEVCGTLMYDITIYDDVGVKTINKFAPIPIVP